MTVENITVSAPINAPTPQPSDSVITSVNIKKLKIKEKTLTKKEKAKSPLPIGTVFMTVICALLLMFIVFISIEVTDYNASVAKMSNDMKQLVEEEEELRFKLSQKNDLEYIEQMASSLGMVKEDKLPKKYVSVAGDDQSKVLDSTEEKNDYSISALLSALGDSLNEIMEYIGS